MDKRGAKDRDKGENSRRSTGEMKTKNLVALSLLKALRAPGDASALGSLSRGAQWAPEGP